MVQKRRRVATATADAGRNNKYCTCGQCLPRTLARNCRENGGVDVCAHGIKKYDCRNATCNPKQAQMCSECTSECGTYKSGCARKEIGSCISAKGLGYHYPMCGCGSRKTVCKKNKPHCPFRNPKPEA